MTPSPIPDGLIRDWLDEHGTLFEDRVFTGESQLRVQGFLTGRDPLAGGEPSLGRGVWPMARCGWWRQTMAHSRSQVGGALDLALVWRVARRPTRLTSALFAGLFDEQGRRWAQADERPLGSLLPAGRLAGGRFGAHARCACRCRPARPRSLPAGGGLVPF